MSLAGSNEVDFRTRMGYNASNGNNLLGKLRFGNKNDANISVDGHFIYNNKLYLVEIDSANEAKLLAGQYILLDALYDKNKYSNISKENCVFLVIHYFKKYKPERTEKTLEALKNQLNTTLNFMAFHQTDISNWKDLLRKIDIKSK